jgi:hypothetical protein
MDNNKEHETGNEHIKEHDPRKDHHKEQTLARGITKGKTTAQNTSKIPRPRGRGRIEITPTIGKEPRGQPPA